MKSQRSIVRRAAKRRASFKDFTRRKNINANVPTSTREEKIDKFATVFDSPVVGFRRQVFSSDGSPKLEAVGRKTILVKEKVYIYTDPYNPTRPLRDEYQREVGMIPYPKRRKYQEAVAA